MTRTKSGRKRISGLHRILATSTALALAATIASPAWAQDEPQEEGGALPNEEATASSGNEMIVITGSRIKRDGFEDQVPATVISAERIENLGQVNIGEVLTSIPQNASFQSDTNAGPSTGSRANSNIGASYANLRGLNPFYGTRTLTLVDSRRFVPTSDSGAVDVNLIPSTLISRVETVTGGASASYGTDAVAGVVNFILDTDFSGFKLHSQAGTTTHQDGETLEIGAAFGTDIGERMHLLVSGETYSADAIDTLEAMQDRGFYTQSARVTNPDPNGRREIIRPFVSPTNYTNGGIINQVGRLSTRWSSCPTATTARLPGRTRSNSSSRWS